jgi:hypothetical protein
MGQVVVELSGDEAKLLRSLQKIIDQNGKVGDSFKRTQKNGKDASDALTTGLNKLKGELLGMAGAYASVSTAISLVADAQERWKQNQQASLSLAKELAAAQQEAAKNLAGNPIQSISDTLQKKVPEIALKASFSDLPKLTTALGSASSILQDDAKAASATETAAILTRNTKDDLQSTTTSTADVMKAANLQSGKEAMALLLSAGAVARPEELPKLASGASKAIYAGVNASPNQSPEQAAKEAAALYAVFSKVDKQGESASTAAIQFIDLLRETFNPNRDETIKRDERITELTREAVVTPDKLIAIEQAQLEARQKQKIADRLSPDNQTDAAQKIRLEAQAAQANIDKSFRSAGFNAEEQKQFLRSEQVMKESREKGDLQKAGMFEIGRQNIINSAGLSDRDTEELRRLNLQRQLAKQDPGSLQGRLELVQKNPELLRTAEANLKGEAAFKPIAQGFFDPKSVHMQGLADAFKNVTTDPKVFEESVQTMTITPQQKTALAIEKADTRSNVGDMKDTVGANIAAMRDMEEKALAKTSVDYATTIESKLYSFSRPLQNPENAAEFSMQRLSDREKYFENTKNTNETIIPKIELLITTMEQVIALSRATPGVSEASIQRQTEILEATRESFEKRLDRQNANQQRNANGGAQMMNAQQNKLRN